MVQRLKKWQKGLKSEPQLVLKSDNLHSGLKSDQMVEKMTHSDILLQLVTFGF